MLTTEVRAEWNRKAALLSDSDTGEVNRGELFSLLIYAAANAPTADGVNLLRLFEGLPQAQGTVVPERMAPAEAARVALLTRSTQGRGRSPAAPPAPAPVASIPEGFRETLKSLGVQMVEAAEILGTVAEEDSQDAYDALRADALALQEVAENPTATASEALQHLGQTRGALTRAREVNDLASFVLGRMGDDLAQSLEVAVGQAERLRDTAPAVAANPVAAARPTVPVPEWNEQIFADVSGCLSVDEMRDLRLARQSAVRAAGLPDDLDGLVGWRLTDPDDHEAAVQIATFVLEVASGADAGSEEFTLPEQMPADRWGDVLAVGVDAAVGWLKPIYRAAGSTVSPADHSLSTGAVVEAIAPAAAAPVVVSAPVRLPTATAPARVTPVAPPVAAETHPEPINQGDWIEWEEPPGKTLRGQVSYIWQVGRIIPGRRTEPQEEYSIHGGGTVRPEHRPRKVNGPELESPGVPVDPLAATIVSVLASPSFPRDAEFILVGRLRGLGSEPGDAVPGLLGDEAALARYVVVAFLALDDDARENLLAVAETPDGEFHRWVQSTVRNRQFQVQADAERQSSLQAQVAAGDESAPALLESVVRAQAARAQNFPDDLVPLTSEPDFAEEAAESIPEEAPDQVEVAGETDNTEEGAARSSADIHAGSYRVWFLTTAARARLDAAPWSGVLDERVSPDDYELVAQVDGAHAHEVFARLQNGLVDWADGADPGAEVHLNMGVRDGRLRRRSMDFGDLVESVVEGECLMIGPDDLVAVPHPGPGLSPAMPPRWEQVAVRAGFVEAWEEESEEAEAAPAVRSGRGR